jgi:AcrR family transcriptional regulator
MATRSVAADEEQDHEHEHEDEGDDAEHLHPEWRGVGRPALGPPTGVVAAVGVARRVSHVSWPPPSRLVADVIATGDSLRDSMSLSSHGVSIPDAAYTDLVPRVWNETIQAHRREVRDAILDTTAALVAEHGLRSVAMSQIAEETGIARATLYKYFSGVEAILFAWHERQITGHLEYLAEVRDRAGDPAERLEAVLEAYALIRHESHGRHDAGLAAFLHRDEHVAHAQEQLREMIRDLLVEAAETGNLRDDVAPDELATYCLHALAAARRLSSEAAARRLVTVTLAGLRPGA